MKLHTWILSLLLILMLILLPPIINQPKETKIPEAYLVGMSQANLVEPWRVTMNYEIQDAAAEHPELRMIFTDAAQSTDRQIEDVNMLMGYGIDLLIISPNDVHALRPVLSEVFQKIPVIVLDRAVGGDEYTLFIGSNNDSIGYQAGKLIGEMLGEEGGSIVEILGTEGSPPVAARSEGFARALNEYPNVTLEKQLVGNWLQDRAEDRFKEYLVMTQNTPDVVFAHNDAMAYGAYIAADKLRIEDIRFVGVDGLEGEGSGKDLVERGVLSATFYCPTGGRQAVECALEILSGGELTENRMILNPTQIMSDNEGEET